MNQQTLFTTPAETDCLREVGEFRKQRGMSLAADKRAEAVAAGQVAFLRSLLESPDGTATIDNATDDLTHRFDGGGKWRGTVCRSLAVEGITAKVGVVLSDRPSRHRGYLTCWRLIDRQKAERKLKLLAAWLSAMKTKNPQSAGTDAGTESTTTTHTKRKESCNAIK